ncbi:MAG: peptidylprolyl isomerase [Pseudomonadota bacterium]
MPIQDGDIVSVHYTGTLSDGTIFDTSVGQDPMTFTLGQGMLIPGFEAAVLGMAAVGDTVKVTIPADEAYGEYNEEMIIVVPRSEVPEHIEPEVGLMVQLVSDEGELEVGITEVTDEAVTLDANHPLAGQALTFEIELVKIGE